MSICESDSKSVEGFDVILGNSTGTLNESGDDDKSMVMISGGFCSVGVVASSSEMTMISAFLDVFGPYVLLSICH